MYGLVQDGEPFKVFVRREAVGAGLLIRFECKEGMGVLGVRRPGRADPAPVAAYEEEGVDPAALRAGRFVHVLGSGQRQSYALSRLSQEIAGRIPTERWIELEPHTEYGFRYLVAADGALDKTTASVSVGLPPPPPPAAVRDEQTTLISPPRGPATGSLEGAAPAPITGASPLDAAGFPVDPRGGDPRTAGLRSLPPLTASASSPPPAPTLAPALSEAAVGSLSRDQAITALRAEIAKVHSLHQRITELEEVVKRARIRERDLLELLTRWSS